MKKLPKSVYDLPELPMNLLCIDGEMGYSVEEPVVTFFPKGAPSPKEPEPKDDHGAQPHCSSSSQTTHSHYHISFLYPKISCFPNNAPETEGLFSRFRNRDLGKPTRAVSNSKMFFKLSSLPQIKPTDPPLFCTVVYGPWIADVREIGSCSQNCQRLPNLWEFSCVSLPELVFNWYGTWGDAPLGYYPNLQIISQLQLVQQKNVCCPGYSENAAGWCVPDILNDPFD